LSTVRSAELIAVIDGGELRAAGTHAQLVSQGSMYAEFAAQQLIS
jgi:ABC-type multidrug transport system fused ATPase/permease subunit